MWLVWKGCQGEVYYLQQNIAGHLRFLGEDFCNKTRPMWKYFAKMYSDNSGKNKTRHTVSAQKSHTSRGVTIWTGAPCSHWIEM